MIKISFEFLKKLRKERRNKRSEANKLNKPIPNCLGYCRYWFPKRWNWHERCQFISKMLFEYWNDDSKFIDNHW